MRTARVAIGAVMVALALVGISIAGEQALGAEPLGSVPTLIGDVPVSGDWDGNGSTTIGVFRNGSWFLRNSNSGGGVDVAFGWGSPGHVPVVGDWDGNGTTTVGVFRDGEWFLRNSNSGGGVDVAFGWGSPGDVPLVGDWDGNGTSTIGVRRGDQFFLRNSNSAGGVDVDVPWGVASDVPIVGDWDGNDTTTIGVFRAGTWLLRNSNSGGGVDTSFDWGAPTDVPLTGDWDGNNTTTIGVRRFATFYQRNANTSGGIDTTIGWGLPTAAVAALPANGGTTGSLTPVPRGVSLWFPAGTPCGSPLLPADFAATATCQYVPSRPFPLLLVTGSRPTPGSAIFRDYVAVVYGVVGSHLVPLYSLTDGDGNLSYVKGTVADLTGDGFPELIFSDRNLGTGDILNYDVFTGTGRRLGGRSVYKGVAQIVGADIVEYEPVYLPNEPNCCPSGRHRVTLRVVGDTLVTIADVPVPIDTGGPSQF